MKNLLKYLKKSRIAILLVFLLLVAQAYCDLALPGYTSDMVNVGIQQSGITSDVPTVIRESKLNTLLLFSNKKEKKEVLKSYKLLEKNKTNISKYPLLEKENIYILKGNATVNLSKFFKKTFTIDNYINTNKDIKVNLLNKIPNSKELEQLDIYSLLTVLPENVFNEIKNNANKQINKTEDSILTQAAISLVKTEYQEIGINTDNIQTNYIIKTGSLMLLVAFISMFITIIVAYFSSKISATLGKDLRNSVFTKVLGFSSAEFKQYSTASLITRSTNDIQQVQTLLVMLLRVVFYAPIMAIGGIIKVLNTNTQMTWIIAVAVAIIFLFVIILFAVAMPKFKLMQKLIDKLNLVSRETLSGLSVIRAFSKEQYEEKRFDKANTNLMKTNLFVNRTMALMMPIMMLIMNIIMVTIIWVGAKHIDLGNMQVGDMMAFMQYTMEIVMSFLMISMISIVLPRALVSVNRINEIVETKLLITNPKTAKDFDKEKKGIVEFRDVSFRYPDADYDVITDITFTAMPGQTTAIIGSTGSGKSSIVNLIPRFFDVNDGQILIDGVNIKEVNLKDLRKKIGFVPQKGILFSGTIRSNITYGNENISDLEIDKALEISQSKEFVCELDEGIDSKISQGGKNVSGGQRQRLSIARAIAINPDIFVFDDSFSALDFKTDAKLRHDLKQITKDKTVIIVAQRISTIMNANQIIVLEEGKIVGKGTHQQLMKNCEVYKQIALSQLSEEEAK
ncbi:MAG: ABC transporter ATP-binding protein [Bacilli bacterium]|nr:ABC transporter ATP-binding protein [Bacilli bacterium]